MSSNTIPVSIQIMEKEYRIACEKDQQDSLLASAKLLDNKMNEIRESGKVIGSDRIAVMAALNLAHELLQQQQSLLDENRLSQQLKGLRDKVDMALNEARQMEL